MKIEEYYTVLAILILNGVGVCLLYETVNKWILFPSFLSVLLTAALLFMCKIENDVKEEKQE